jgi:subtilisin family serine protease
MPSSSRSGEWRRDHRSAEFNAGTRARMDPYLLSVVELLEQGDWDDLRHRTGIRHDPSAPAERPHSLALLVELAGRRGEAAGRRIEAWIEVLGRFRLLAAQTSLLELESNAALEHVTARIELDAKDPRCLAGTAVRLADHLAAILEDGAIARLELATSCHPHLESSVRHLGLQPAGPPRRFGGRALTGKGVVVGIVDDGCALAHRHVLVRKADGSFASRIAALWDQSRSPDGADRAAGWTDPTIAAGGDAYGRELGRAAIEAAVNAQRDAAGDVDEDAVYARLGYAPGAPDDLTSHGTHVVDIAAGNGNLGVGGTGVAPEADIVFVQLPPVDIAQPGPALSKSIVDAVEYVFAQAGNRPAVVNLSFGGNRGPHHAGYAWTKVLDDVLALPNRALVVAAGNGFEQRTHARADVPAQATARLRWILPTADRTPNDIEVWFRASDAFTLTLVAPDGGTYGPLGNGSYVLARTDGAIIGRVEFVDAGSDSVILLALRATEATTLVAAPAPAPAQAPAQNAGQPLVFAPAPAGLWTIDLHNLRAAAATFDAWIQRDDLGPPGAAPTQSRFDVADADPGTTVADLACGTRSIAVGAYNCATDEVCRYSSAGPTRSDPGGGARRKPEVCAPAESDVAGLGVLSASSQRALPARMNGTSAAAPHVAGLVALMFEYAASLTPPRVLTAEEIRAALVAGGRAADLKPHAVQAVDARVPVKQASRWNALIGGGRVDFRATMRKLFP